MSAERIDVLAVMNLSAEVIDGFHLERWSCKSPTARQLDDAREAVAELIAAADRTVRAFETLGKAAAGFSSAKAHQECESAMVAQKGALARIAPHGKEG